MGTISTHFAISFYSFDQGLDNPGPATETHRVQQNESALRKSMARSAMSQCPAISRSYRQSHIREYTARHQTDACLDLSKFRFGELQLSECWLPSSLGLLAWQGCSCRVSGVGVFIDGIEHCLCCCLAA